MRKVIVAMLVVCSVSLFSQSAAGVRWTAPAGWTAEGPRPMRAATYSIAPVTGDEPGAECVINYFGPGQGGTIDANIERWKTQMRGEAGQPAAATVAKRTVRGLAMTTIDASGAYAGMGGPMAASPRLVPGYRLLGAIVEGPGGNVFVKLTGPAKTIAANRQKFEQLLASFQPDK